MAFLHCGKLRHGTTFRSESISLSCFDSSRDRGLFWLPPSDGEKIGVKRFVGSPSFAHFMSKIERVKICSQRTLSNWQLRRSSASGTGSKLAVMKMHMSPLLLAATSLTLGLSAASLPEWQHNAISPVVNPIFFESPLIQSEVR